MVEGSHSVEIRYFAAAAEAAGCSKEVLDLPVGSDLGLLRGALLARHGSVMEPILRVSAYLIDGEMTRDSATATGDRVDVLPPFAGG